MEWGSIIGGVCGAAIALAGALLTDLQRSRRQRNRDREVDQIRHYMEFTLALDAAHNALREVAQSPAQQFKRSQSANRAVHEAGVFATRERLLMTGTADLVKIGETAYMRLIAIRNAVRAGADLQSAEYHSAYHRFAEAIWRFRMAVRSTFDHSAISPADLGRTGWSEREDCRECARVAA